MGRAERWAGAAWPPPWPRPGGPRDDLRPPDPADVVLVPVEPRERAVLWNLVQLYRHDMSEFRGYELGEDGTYAYDHLDAFLEQADREAWFIRVEGRLAGFVLINRRPDGVWQISEHFVARSSRGRGVGRMALAKAFSLHEGRWTCFVDEVNGISERMCVAAAAEATGSEARTSRGVNRTGFVGTVFRFAVPAGGAARTPAPSPGCCAPAPIVDDVGAEGPGSVTCC